MSIGRFSNDFQFGSPQKFLLTLGQELYDKV